ncbi:S-phase kinase-associated protein 2 isoform X2 [Manduca sexta]|uniref:S-phase kinase-associated protein 2 isoform X2 n=1 Tax=Manduca sexta TaxID=7130 RepID=UPI0018904072|nr:S-phase kinase-associated protein 2 isoform X2 [Manduca sexta]
MSANSGEDDFFITDNLEDADVPRKKARGENSARKSWSLMDKKTSYEVLQEMGVSLLEPDDNEAVDPNSSMAMHHHRLTVKRKRDIENVNPNINTAPSPRSKCSPRSKLSPGPSRVKSPRSCDKYKSVVSEHELDATMVGGEILVDEETPLGRCVSAGSLPMRGVPAESLRTPQPLGVEEELILSRRHKPEPSGVDSFDILSEEMMLSIFRWLPKRTLAHCMTVCKRWYRVACDETLWQRLDLGNKTLSKDALGRILARKPIIVRLASTEIGEWRPTTPAEPSRIQFLDLSMATLDPVTLDHLLERCPGLKKLSLESVQLQDSTCRLIGKCTNLETLNLAMAQGVTAEGLAELLKGCVNLQSLNISWCNLDEDCLEVLVTMLPQRLQRLNVSGARIMDDETLRRLCSRCARVVELDASDCPRLSGGAAAALARLARLEHLALSRCYLMSVHALSQLSGAASLQYLEVWGMLHSAPLAALRAALPAVHLNHFMFSAIARPTVGTRRTSIWGLRTRD